MKYLLLLLIGLSFSVQSQINYTVTVTKLMAQADDCDGEVTVSGFTLCPFAPQDPVFQLWVSDEDNSNENYYCWAFDSDDNQAYGIWNDIPNVEIANETNISSDYLTFEASGFESDFAVVSCSQIPLLPNAWDLVNPDESIYDRQFLEQIPFDLMQNGVPYTHTLSLGGVYFFEIEILKDNFVSINKVEDYLSFSLSPNPNNGDFTIKLNEGTINDGSSIYVRDIMGKIIYTEEMSSSKTRINLSSKESGVYFVTVEANDKSATQKVVLK